jgi:hypothetical protein
MQKRATENGLNPLITKCTYYVAKKKTVEVDSEFNYDGSGDSKGVTIGQWLHK